MGACMQSQKAHIEDDTDHDQTDNNNNKMTQNISNSNTTDIHIDTDIDIIMTSDHDAVLTKHDAVSPHQCVFANSSSSMDSMTTSIDGPMPPLNHLPSYSTASVESIKTNKPRKLQSVSLETINDDESPNNNGHDVHHMDDIDEHSDEHEHPEIDDTNHVEQYSDEAALEAIKSSSGSHDVSSHDTDLEMHHEINHNNNNIETNIDGVVNGKEEYESDDDDRKKQERSDDDDLSLNTSEDDDEDEPSPEQNGGKFMMTVTEPLQRMEELSDITYKCIQSANATQSGTSKGKSKTNQDSLICIDSFGPSSIFQLYGVCDGHGPNGNNVSQFVTDNLPSILNDLLTNSLHKLSIKSILKKSFELIENKLTKLQLENTLDFDINYSGTTATIGLFAGNKLYIANIGDSRTVLGQIPPNTNNQTKKRAVPRAIALSTDHDPTNSSEAMRIKKSKSARILIDDEDDSARIQIELPAITQNMDNLLTTSIPQIANNDNKKSNKSKHRRTQSQVRKISASVSRSLGDRIAHEYGGLISEPEITIHSLCEEDIFVIFASDGIWQMIDNDDVMRSVGTKLFQNKQSEHYEDLQKSTGKLVREANILWQDEYEDYTDDITCVITRIGKI